MKTIHENENDLKILRHSATHLLAQAVSELYPQTKLTIGPATEEGFFYDFLPVENFKEEDLEILSKKMEEISKRNLPILHKEIEKSKARQLYKDNPFKLELINGIEGDTVGLSTQGNFYDLCRGGHVESTGQIKYFKLLSLAGAYWRADKNKQALQRIYGTAFFTQDELDKFITQQEEALKYDHRKIGKQLDLFSFQPEGPGFPFFHPKGKSIFNRLIAFMRKLHEKYNYQEISTPTMLSSDLWVKSGHYMYYKDNMYFCNIDEKQYAIKPMNCPGSILVYDSRPRSYRELPLKLAEFGHVHRHELSGVLHGLFRVRAFTQDDAHIYCTVNQIEEQVSLLIKLILEVFNTFEFKDFQLALSTRPEKSMGNDDLWNTAINALKNSLDKSGQAYKIQEGEGAFYGPKIEFVIQDSMGRSWQCGTIQVDFMQPENFNISYVASSGLKERPVIIHQAIYGSLERFFAILIEHFRGNFPFWLAPIQVRILTIKEDQNPYAQEIYNALTSINIKTEIINSQEPISAKIKDAQIEKIPMMLVIGKKEQENKTVSIRYLDGTQKMGLSIEQLISEAKEKNKFNY